MYKSALQNLSILIGGIFSLYIAYLTAQGTLQEYIYFADPLNEMGFCITSFTMGVMCIYCGIPSRHWKNLKNFLFPYSITITKNK